MINEIAVQANIPVIEGRSMNDETNKRLKVILAKEQHNGFISFLVENLDRQQENEWSVTLDKCSRQWNLLPEKEKLSWDILVELQGGIQEMMKLLVKVRSREKNNQADNENKIGHYERRLLRQVLKRRRRHCESVLNSACRGSEAWSWAKSDIFAIANIECHLGLKGRIAGVTP